MLIHQRRKCACVCDCIFPLTLCFVLIFINRSYCIIIVIFVGFIVIDNYLIVICMLYRFR